MNKTKQRIDTLSIFIFESISVSEELVKVEIFIFRVYEGNISFNAKELSGLRDVLRISLGKHVDTLSAEDLGDFGATMLRVTAIMLKAKYLSRKSTT